MDPFFSTGVPNTLDTFTRYTAYANFWAVPSKVNLLDEFRRKQATAPFHWKINAKEDSMKDGRDGYTYVLRSGPNHKGMPVTDQEHYWLLYFQPGENSIVDAIKTKL